MAVPPSMSIYGAIHRYENEQTARSRFSLSTDRDANVSGIFSSLRSGEQAAGTDAFGNIYTIRYRPVPQKNAESTEDKSAKKKRRCKKLDIPIFPEPALRPKLLSPGDYQNHIPSMMIPFRDTKCPSIILNEEFFGLVPRCNPVVPPSLANDSTELYTQALLLLKFLFELNRGYWRLPFQVLGETDTLQTTYKVLPESMFYNNKLIAKLKRQLADAMIVTSGLVPAWCRDLSHSFGFLFPMEIRIQFMQNTSFGTARALMVSITWMTFISLKQICINVSMIAYRPK
jgi:hypothetical protein